MCICWKFSRKQVPCLVPALFFSLPCTVFSTDPDHHIHSTRQHSLLTLPGIHTRNCPTRLCFMHYISLWGLSQEVSSFSPLFLPFSKPSVLCSAGSSHPSASQGCRGCSCPAPIPAHPKHLPKEPSHPWLYSIFTPHSPTQHHQRSWGALSRGWVWHQVSCMCLT